MKNILLAIYFLLYNTTKQKIASKIFFIAN